MAESILFEALSNILSKLALLAGQELGWIFGQKRELEKLQGTLKTIEAVILDAEEKQESDHVVKNLISRLKDVVSDAEDLLDEFDYEILRQKVRPRGQVRKIFRSFKMGPRVKEIREGLDVCAGEISKFGFTQRSVGPDKKSKNPNREAPAMETLIIGREEEKEHIIELLKEKNHGNSIFNSIAIVGLGGLGKTSLARLVYHDAEVADSFERIWVCVSEEFNVHIIFKNILKCLRERNVDNWNLNEVQKEIDQKLKGKRCLLVLDDVWNENVFEWKNFLDYLVFGAPGSKIIVTTRSTKVAATMGVHSPYLLKGLNEEQSQELFEKVAFEGGQIDPKLGQIGKVVAKKCKGVPLSIKCLGGLMRQKPDENYWLSVQENEIWNKDDVLSVLKLSYDQLSSNLKQCFTFCSLFPKDSRMRKDELIYHWRAQGYIQLRGENENIQDIGDEYFNDLLSISFFQEKEEDYRGIIFCKMHDLIHDLALSVAGHQFRWMKNEEEKKLGGVRHVSLEKNSKEVALVLSKTKGIRTIIFQKRIFRNSFVQNVTFSSLNCLRMLNLRNMSTDILPDSIGELKHLRYLDLSANRKMKVLPDAITKLHHLQTLLLDYCDSLEELPRDIQYLISLEYLNIDNCPALKYLSKGLGELTSLQRLGRFIVNSVEASFSIAATLNELRDLNGLGNSLTIEHLDKVKNVELESKEANLKKKKRLQSLQLSWESSSPTTVASGKDESLLNNLEPHPNLKRLKVYGYGGARFSSWLSSLTNLVKLVMYRFWNCQHLPSLDHLSSLKYLSLRFSRVLKPLPPLDHLSSLESLSLIWLDAIEHLSPLDHLSSLKYLELVSLNALEYVADSFPLPCSTSRKPFFPSLKEVKIVGCLNLKGWWRTQNENQGSTAELPYFPCLSELEIRDSPNLTSMPLFPSLDQELTLWGTSIRPLQQTLKMKMTEASMTSEEASSSSGGTCHSYSSTTLPLSNLKRLTLGEIVDLEALPVEFLQNLASLTYLILDDCPNLESLPRQNMSCLSSLQELRVQNCPYLKDFPDWILNLTSLKTLRISGDLELQYMPEGTHLLTSLEELFISCCNDLKAWRYLIPNLTSLKMIHICKCLESQYLQEWMHSPTSSQLCWIHRCPYLSCSGWGITDDIKTLIIRGCLDFYFWEISYDFGSLEEVNVQNCPNLEGFLYRISYRFTSLKTLKICKCPELQDLPLRMDCLTSLQVLSVSGCPQLSEKCEKETGILWPRIAHIPSIIIDGRQIQ